MGLNKTWVQIVWLDITSKSEPWISLDEAVEMEPAMMVTVGCLLEENASFVTIASTLDISEELVGDVNCIPRGTILEIKPIASVNIAELCAGEHKSQE